MSYEPTAPRQLVTALPAKEILFTLVIAGYINAQYIRIVRQFEFNGPLVSLSSTFGISIVVWVAAFAVLALIRKSAPHQLSKLDLLVVVLAIIFILSPVTAMSALSLTFLSCYFLTTSKDAEIKRAMRLLLALAAAVMWGRFAFSFFLPYILQIDATFAAVLTGLRRSRNLILASDGVTLLQVGAGCSSFLNITNAILGWATGMIYFDKRVSAKSIFWLVTSIASMIAINTFRISLIGWWPSYYWLIHGDIGANTTNVLASLSIFLFASRAVMR